MNSLSSASCQPVPADMKPLVEAWFASLTPREQQLQLLAATTLKTSYFPEKTHGFRAWLAKQKQPRAS